MAQAVQKPITILKTPSGYWLITDLSFKFAEKKAENFADILSAFDKYIGEVRNDAIKKMANSLGFDVNWTD